MKLKPKVRLNTTRSNQSLLCQRRDHHVKNPTASEIRIKAMLESLGERFIFQKGFYTGRTFFIVDFYLKKRKKLCLEIDGGYHKEQVDYDARRTEYLTNVRKLRVLRLSNAEADAITADELWEFITPAGE